MNVWRVKVIQMRDVRPGGLKSRRDRKKKIERDLYLIDKWHEE